MNSRTKRYGLSVGAIVRDQEGHILVLRRADDAKHFSGQWEPPGGKVDEGEDIDRALCRETKEETNLDVAFDSVAGCAEFELPHLRVAMLYFNAHVTGGELIVSPEHTIWRWESVDELRTLPL